MVKKQVIDTKTFLIVEHLVTSMVKKNKKQILSLPRSPTSVQPQLALIISKYPNYQTRQPNEWVSHRTVRHRTIRCDSVQLLYELVSWFFRCWLFKHSYLVHLVYFHPALQKKLRSCLVFAGYSIMKCRPVILRQQKKKIKNQDFIHYIKFSYTTCFCDV